MSRVVTAGRLRQRLAITFALVAAIATGALALGTYLVVRDARLDDSVDSSLAQARTNLVLAGTVLRGSSAPQDVADLLEFYTGRPDYETVALVGGEAFGSSSGRTQIPAGVQRLVRNGELAFKRVRIADTPYIVAGGRPPASQAELYFFFSERALHDELVQLRTILLVGWVIVVALAAAAGALVARRVLRPVGQASAAAHALAEGLLETRLPIETEDEFGAWAASFNEMAEALEEKIRALSEAQARERRFTADVAHELRTPVTALAGEASLLAEHLERMPPEAKRTAQLLVEDVGRLRRLVEELIEISRLDAGREDVRTEPVDLASLAAGLLQSAHDCSDGGLAIALAECAFDTGGIGLTADIPASTSTVAALFGESASRAVVSVTSAHLTPLVKLAGDLGVPAQVIGRTGGSRITMTVAGSAAIDTTVAEAEHLWANALGGYFVRASA